jgi:hypothetical protein
LAWRPVRGERAEDVLPVLRVLFAEHGPPLVLKSDNGSAFIAGVLHDLLGEADVAQLFSPVRRPQYNGALERSNGMLKTYTHHHAVCAGHPFRWTSDDVEHARQLANTISRPWGDGGPSPEQAWNLRSPIPTEKRQAFAAALGERRAWAARELDLDPAAELSVADRARLDRLAISQTLQDLGYLTLRPVRRPPQKPKRLTRKKLARRVARFCGQSPSSASLVAIDPTPRASPEPVPAGSGTLSGRPLAEPPSTAILLAVSDTIAPQALSQEIPSAHGERTSSSWLRRSLTPLLSLWKTAEISR